ncbi:MAG: GNAT family N-acetyltransferase [Hyphomicrobiales bacterium]|jgi:GNAT superfamily N-acetyltransferase|nr:GNAT family N-acetyltransferase [Hyphomicrobiales bacterium]
MATVQVEKTYAKARKAILKGLVAYNRSQIGRRKWKNIAITIRNDAGDIVGGVTGEAWADWLFIQLLWLDEAHRGQDLASRAMDAVEDEARAFGAKHAYLDTFSFQARPFYEKRGYRVFGTLENYPDAHSRYWMTKSL